MGVLSQKATRRSTRVRVEMPVSVISLDRMRPFADKCKVLVVSAQGCGFQSSRALQLETPIMINDLPGGGSVTGRVANCLPLGSEGKYFLIGVSLYTHGNVWGIANPPPDWSTAAGNDPTAHHAAPESVNRAANATASGSGATTLKKVWPYNLFSEGAESPKGRK
jgi:hypothetical protein